MDSSRSQYNAYLAPVPETCKGPTRLFKDSSATLERTIPWHTTASRPRHRIVISSLLAWTQSVGTANTTCVTCGVTFGSLKMKKKHSRNYYICRRCGDEFRELHRLWKHRGKGCSNKRYAGDNKRYVWVDKRYAGNGDAAAPTSAPSSSSAQGGASASIATSARADMRDAELPTYDAEHEDWNSRDSAHWCVKCNFGFGSPGELRAHVESGAHRRFIPGLKPIRGDAAYSGPLEHDRAEMLDFLDSLRLAGHAYRLRLAGQKSGGGDLAAPSHHGEEEGGDERRDYYPGEESSGDERRDYNHGEESGGDEGGD